MVNFSGRYGFSLIILALISLTAIIFFFFNIGGTSGLAREFCLTSGYDFELRTYENVNRGYCVFNDECLVHGVNDSFTKLGEGVISRVSYCLATEFYEGTCFPCEKVFLNCSAYEGLSVCSQEVEPVCARIRIGVAKPYRYEERTIGNACTACVNSRDDFYVTGYVEGDC